jgi:hypothetical protein
MFLLIACAANLCNRTHVIAARLSECCGGHVLIRRPSSKNMTAASIGGVTPDARARVNPAMPDNVLDYAPAEEFDTGLFVARYLLALAVLSVAWMIALPVFFDTFELDLSPILLLMFASALKRHSPAARTLLLVIGGFGLLICVWMVVHALVFGTAHMTVHFGRPIHHPALWQVFLAAGSVALVIGVPFAVLLSPRARRQFREAAAEAK